MIDHSYFSGKKNIDSMKIEYRLSENELSGKFKLKKTHVSYNNVVHGGLIAAILDDAMAYHINHQGIKAFTARLEIKFKKPLKIHAEYIITAKIIKLKKRYILTQGAIEDKNKEIYALANAIFIEER